MNNGELAESQSVPANRPLSEMPKTKGVRGENSVPSAAEPARERTITGSIYFPVPNLASGPVASVTWGDLCFVGARGPVRGRRCDVSLGWQQN